MKRIHIFLMRFILLPVSVFASIFLFQNCGDIGLKHKPVVGIEGPDFALSEEATYMPPINSKPAPVYNVTNGALNSSNQLALGEIIYLPIPANAVRVRVYNYPSQTHGSTGGIMSVSLFPGKIEYESDGITLKSKRSTGPCSTAFGYTGNSINLSASECNINRAQQWYFNIQLLGCDLASCLFAYQID